MSNRAVSSETSTFAAASRVRPGDDGYDIDVDPGWTVGGKPNGGYLLAIAARAAVASVAHDYVLAASAHYLHSPDPGPANVRTEVLRAGRSASQVRTTLVQNGNPCVDAVFTVGTLDPDDKPYWTGALPQPGSAPFEECVRIQGTTPTGLRLALMDQVDLRIEPADLGFTRRRPTGAGHLHGWLELPGEDFDPVSLQFAIDSFPPATMDVVISGWVPTLELTTYVVALPAPGPVQILQRADLIQAGRFVESCFVWDVNGQLVAYGTQLAGIRIPTEE